MNGKTYFKTFLIVALVATVFLVAFYLVVTFWPKSEPMPAIEITAADAEGEIHALSSHLGKESVALVFFELDHRHSQEVMQRIVPAAKKAGVALYAVCVSEKTPEECLARMKELKMPTPDLLLFDTDGSASAKYGVSAPPCTYFIDKSGLIVEGYLGTISEETIANELQAIA